MDSQLSSSGQNCFDEGSLAMCEEVMIEELGTNGNDNCGNMPNQSAIIFSVASFLAVEGEQNKGVTAFAASGRSS